ncbi:MAG: hypothetical protein J6B71_01670 [Clostridia bacterium]|nr:hypothetical protein [Clostridia bacterium]
MLYKKNGKQKLERELFEHPTSEYRGTPFWAWNTKLEKGELLRQIDEMKSMGFGGYHIHSRAGMATEYLGRDFMDMVKLCNEKAKQEGMLTWLYDEDRWPSGCAGGFVTRNPKYRQKFILFTQHQKTDTVDRQTGYETGKPYLLASYDVSLNADGTLNHYKRISEDAVAAGTKWYVYVCTPELTGRYNGQTYVDTMDEEAIAEFLRITYDAYYREIGKDFGKSVPAIFTDEPQFCLKQTLAFAESQQEITLPWTHTFAESFKETYGTDLLEHLPQLLWDLPNGKPSRVRVCYHDHACERFTRAFMDQCGAWCRAHGIALTGHVMREDFLAWQTEALGETMRTYRGFDIPGIDVLCDETLFATAKQCQSVVHQKGAEAMLSELYGVTGWDFDFRHHKYQGDWQAALGVTVRVPHLTWMCMKGCAKRDYPASIGYQSAWYSEYSHIEDHFARVNTAMTRGTPIVRVAVIHPIESFWLHYGPSENTAEAREQLQYNFDCVTNWLLRGTVDFDYISESLLPEQYRKTEDATLGVGKMQYDAVIVPGLETIRSTTLEALETFVSKGGKLIFMGACPKFADAEESDRPKKLYDRAHKIPFSSVALLDAVKEEREVMIRDGEGKMTDNLICQMRRDGNGKWLFVAHARTAKQPYGYQRGDNSLVPQELRITVKGEYKPMLYDTISGEILPVAFCLRDGNTVISKTVYESDSLLLRLEECEHTPDAVMPTAKRRVIKKIDFKEKAEYSLSEDNVMVLDMAELSFDGKTWGALEEILRIDKKLRDERGYPLVNGRDMQPWLMPKEKITEFPYLRFTFESEIEAPCRLACEELCELIFNGDVLPISYDGGYYTDRTIRTVSMPNLKKGQNELVVRVPFGKTVSMENMFLLGSFGVRVEGCRCVVTKLPEKLCFQSLTTQGMTFYGANLTYKTAFELDRDGDIVVRAERYLGALLSVRIDGKDMGKIVFSPYRLLCKGLKAGKHTLELTFHGTRVNSFNALHNCGNSDWIGNDFWYSTENAWSYEYCLKEIGVLKSPVIDILE